MNLSPQSRIFIYQAKRNFTVEEIQEVEAVLGGFMKEWNSHGTALTGDYALPYDRFIVVAVDEQTAAIGGCSIDSLSRVIKGLESKFQLGLLDNMKVSYELNGEIFTLSLNEFKQKVRNDEISMDANIFHNGVRTLQEFEESWEMPLKNSWVSALIKEPLKE